jgi:hypothetical protein
MTCFVTLKTPVITFFAIDEFFLELVLEIFIVIVRQIDNPAGSIG